MLARFFGKRTPECFLLGRGLELTLPRCGACGKDLDLPDPAGEAFLLAAPMSDLAENGDRNWLFYGTKVLVAVVSARLAPLLNASVAMFGEKVLVAMARNRAGGRQAIVLCGNCAANVLARVNPPNRQHYVWDWLAEFKPRRSYSGAIPLPAHLIPQK